MVTLSASQTGPQRLKPFFFYGFKIQPPRELKTLEQKFSFCHSYYSHHLMPAGIKAPHTNPESLAENRNYLYVITLLMRRKQAPKWD